MRKWVPGIYAFGAGCLFSLSIALLLLRLQPLLYFADLALVYFAASLRWFPRRTTIRKLASYGFIAGTPIPIVLWQIGIPTL